MREVLPPGDEIVVVFSIFNWFLKISSGAFPWENKINDFYDKLWFEIAYFVQIDNS